MEQDNKPQFVTDDDPIVDWPVTVKLPSAGGNFTEYQFSVSMRVLSPKEYEQLLDKDRVSESIVQVASEAEIEADKKAEIKTPATPISEVLERNATIFQRLITGWQGVTDRYGNAVDYSPEKLAGQVTGPRGPALSSGIWDAIHEVRYGRRLRDGTYQDGARLGN